MKNLTAKMMMKIGTLSIALITILAFTSCATKVDRPKAVLVEEADTMFWRIDGTDKRGNPSTIYVQGTIHIGPEKPEISKSVLEKFNNANRVAGEIASDDWAKVTKATQQMMQESWHEDKNILEELNPINSAKMLQLFGGKEALEPICHYEPWIFISTLQNSIYLAAGLSPDYGVDFVLEDLNLAAGRKTIGLDNYKTQLQLIRYGDYDTQLAMLKDMLKDYPFTKTINELYDLYESYKANDKLAIITKENADIEEDKKNLDFYENYYTELTTNRNKDWAKKFDKFLSDGGTTFVFAGCLHFLGEDSVFEQMKKMGYLEF